MGGPFFCGFLGCALTELWDDTIKEFESRDYLGRMKPFLIRFGCFDSMLQRKQIKTWLLLLFSLTLSVETEATERFYLGVTGEGNGIPVTAKPEFFDVENTSCRILVVGGAFGDATVETMRKLPLKLTDDRQILFAFCPDLYPDQSSGKEIVEGDLKNFYRSKSNPEFQYLIGWSAYHLVDTIVVLDSSPLHQIVMNQEAQNRKYPLPSPINARSPQQIFVNSVSKGSKHVGIPLETLVLRYEDNVSRAVESLEVISRTKGKSATRLNFEMRAMDSKLAIEQLLSVYGRKMDSISYIPALAVMSQITCHHLGFENALDGDATRKVVEPLLKKKLPENGSGIAGNLVFVTHLMHPLYPVEYQQQCRERIWEVAGLYDSEETRFGNHRMMPFHSEMSDAVFMGGPILSLAGSLGKSQYFNACLSHLQACAEMNQLDNGLYQHSPLDRTAWGRGNGFAALGAAMSLVQVPQNTKGWGDVKQRFVQHIESLVKFQGPTGSWHQVIDKPQSYPEFTSTCMIAAAIKIAVNGGILDADDYYQILQKAELATLRRVTADGSINNVCTGTGKQKNLRAYYDREALQSQNDRAGAMALIFLTLQYQDKWLQKNGQ